MLEKKKSGVNLFKFLANNTEDLRRVVACVRFLKIVERGFSNWFLPSERLCNPTQSPLCARTRKPS